MNMKSLISAAVLFFTVASVYAQPSRNVSTKMEPHKTTQKFEAVMEYISRLYVDDVNSAQLVEEAIVAMLESLDPHSVYIPKEEMDDMNAPLKGNFEGIGIRFQILKDTIMVVNPIPGGPSEKLGIRAGDKIVEIDGNQVAGVGIKNNQVREKLLGNKGSQVRVGIVRKGDRDVIHFLITRDKIPIYSVDCAYIVSPGIGYIKLNNFAQTTLKEFTTALIKLRQEGMKQLIIDLQGNGGGYLNTAIDLADQFLADGKLIVFTEGRAFPKNENIATSLGLYEKGDLIVLIDESSASASEILGGAIQDWDRGLIVGRRSFGKGLVQRQINLPDSSGMRLTISRYYTPTGRCIQKSYDEGPEAYRMEKYDRFMNGEMTNRDSIRLPDSLRYETLMTKRTVYGGGGIVPDVFVGIDTSMNSDYFGRLIRKGVMNTFALEYVDANRDALSKKYPDFETFKAKFDVAAAMKELIEFGKSEGIEYVDEDYKISKKAMEIRLKASIASNLWESETFYQIINDLNEPLLRSIEILKSGQMKDMKLAYSK
jgi:carboxyl-terminal processing protease